jgi:hypothetical protein
MGILIADVQELLAVLPQICATDPRFYRFLNAAQRQIFLEGNYPGMIGSYNFLLYNGLITLPYECEAILQADILSTPTNVRNQWFEFLQSGPGFQAPSVRRDFAYPDLYDRGDGWCTIQDPVGPFQVQIYCAVPEDPNATVIIEGIDNYGNVIRSQIPVPQGDGTVIGEWMNGVQTLIYANGVAFQEPGQIFSRVTALNLPVRNNDISLFANVLNPQTLKPTGQTLLLGIYPYFMTNPTFRRYAFPAFTATMPPSPVPVNALIRRRPLPLANPNDRLSINNIEALKYFFMAVWKDEEEQWDTATMLRARGKQCLEQETRKNGSAIDRLNIQLRGFGNFPRQPGSL